MRGGKMSNKKIFYSESEAGFYSEAVHGDAIPIDAVEVTQERYAEVMEGQANGMCIVACAIHGARLVDRQISPEEVAKTVDAARQAAYRAEADPVFFKAQRGEATMQQWREKIEEIKARYPDGVMPRTGA